MIRLGGIGTILLIGFIVWALLAPSKTMQLDRACRPVEWAGSLSVSLVAVAYYKGVQPTAGGFQKIDYTCKYALWRLFYERSWQQAIKDGRVDPKTGKPIHKHTGQTSIASSQGTVAPKSQAPQAKSQTDHASSDAAPASSSKTSSEASSSGASKTDPGKDQQQRPQPYPLKKDQ